MRESRERRASGPAGSARRSGVLPARIAGTGCVLPGRAVPTAELALRLTPPRDAAGVRARTGISLRHFAGESDTAVGLAAQALAQALDVAGLEPEALSRIIFVDSLGGDVLAPANANAVAAALGLRDSCGCFDLNNTCLGFLSAVDVAARSVVTGDGPVGIAVCEILSRYITPEEPRPYLVLGDAAVAAVVDVARDGEGILGVSLRNDGSRQKVAMVGHPGVSHARETVRFNESNEEMTRLAIEMLRRRSAEVLIQADLALEEIEWVLPHQPNGPMLELIVDELGIERERVVPVVQEVGSLGAACVPLTLDRLLRSGKVRSGDRILMVGVGAGISSGAMLYRAVL